MTDRKLFALTVGERVKGAKEKGRINVTSQVMTSGRFNSS